MISCARLAPIPEMVWSSVAVAVFKLMVPVAASVWLPLAVEGILWLDLPLPQSLPHKPQLHRLPFQLNSQIFGLLLPWSHLPFDQISHPTASRQLIHTFIGHCPFDVRNYFATCRLRLAARRFAFDLLWTAACQLATNDRQRAFGFHLRLSDLWPNKKASNMANTVPKLAAKALCSDTFALIVSKITSNTLTPLFVILWFLTTSTYLFEKKPG